MSTPARSPNGNDRSSLVDNLLRYKGEWSILRGGASPLPWQVDAIVILQLLVLAIRDLTATSSPLVIPIAVSLVIYLALVAARPANGAQLRLAFLIIVSIGAAVIIPVYHEEPIAGGAFLACLGLLALFFALGTRVTLGAAAIYIAFVAFHMLTKETGRHGPGYELTIVFALISAVFIAMLLQGHFMLRSQVALNALKSSVQEAAQSAEDLQESASIGGMGLFRIDLKTEICEVNSVFRELLEFPEAIYPEVTLDMFASRFGRQGAQILKTRAHGDQYDDLTLLTVIMPDGRTKEVQAMSRRSDINGRCIRSGVILSMQSPD